MLVGPHQRIQRHQGAEAPACERSLDLIASLRGFGLRALAQAPDNLVTVGQVVIAEILPPGFTGDYRAVRFSVGTQFHLVPSQCEVMHWVGGGCAGSGVWVAVMVTHNHPCWLYCRARLGPVQNGGVQP